MAHQLPAARHGVLTSMILVLLAFFIYYSSRFKDTSLEVLQTQDSGVLIRLGDAFSLEKEALNATENLTKRALTVASASDQVYQAAEGKGKLLICYMKDPSTAGLLGTSKWNDFDSLKDWGWTVTATTNWLGENAPGLKDLVGDTGPADKTVRVIHDSEIQAAANADSNFKYPPTNARYENNYYPDKGVIVAESNWSPQTCIKSDQTSKGSDWNDNIDKRPDLFQLSDVWWLIWQHLTSAEQRGNLRHVIQHNVVNINTQEVLARVLRTHWPTEELPSQGIAPGWNNRKEITPDMDGFAALLGSQSIWGIPWMLIQHHRSDQLGQLEVKKITVTTQVVNPRYYQPNLLLELGPVSSS